MTFEKIIGKILDAGIEIKLTKEDGFLWYNLNTMMKSDLSVSKHDGKFFYKTRYSDGNFEDYEDVLFLAKECLCGRDFANEKWIDLLKKEGVLQVITETKVSYK